MWIYLELYGVHITATVVYNNIVNPVFIWSYMVSTYILLFNLKFMWDAKYG